MKKPKTKKKFVCKDCGKSCKNGTGLSVHYRFKHENLKPKEKNIQVFLELDSLISATQKELDALIDKHKIRKDALKDELAKVEDMLVCLEDTRDQIY